MDLETKVAGEVLTAREALAIKDLVQDLFEAKIMKDLLVAKIVEADFKTKKNELRGGV